MNHSSVHLERFEAYLADHNLSRTKPRRLVYRALAAGGPLSLPALVATLDGQADRATVYRTVEFFLANGIGVRVGQEVELGEAFKPHHHHLVCSRCGRSVSIDDNELETELSRIATAHGYRLEAHQVELEGLCRDCAARAA